MTPHDEALLDARMEAKISELKGDVRLNTQATSALKERFDDLAARMSTVPTDIAAMKRDIDYLPTKAWFETRLVGGLTLIAALVAFSEKIHALIK